MSLNSSLYKVLSRCVVNFRKRQLYKKFIDISSLFLELNEICKDRLTDDLFKKRTKIIEEAFDRLTIKIRNNNVIFKVKEFINLYKKVYNPLNKLDEKIFLSLWVFSSFSDIVLEPKTKIKENLFNITCYLIKKITKLCENPILIMDKNFLIDFNKHINIYTEYFNLFIKEDIKIKISESLESYITIKKNIIKIEESHKYDITEKKEIIHIMKNNLNKVKKFISSQIKDFDFLNVDKLVKELIIIESKMVLNYIDRIEKKINNREYDFIKTILNEIQDFIKKFNKIKSDVDLEEIIDPDYIIQLMKNDLLSSDIIINFGRNLVNIITQSGSVRLSELKIEEINNLKNKNLTINGLLANVIYINLESIYLVYDEILSFQELVNELEILDL